jgi:hypothetical protein
MAMMRCSQRRRYHRGLVVRVGADPSLEIFEVMVEHVPDESTRRSGSRPSKIVPPGPPLLLGAFFGVSPASAEPREHNCRASRFNVEGCEPGGKEIN